MCMSFCVIYCISLAWFKQWEAFVKTKQQGKIK